MQTSNTWREPGACFHSNLNGCTSVSGCFKGRPWQDDTGECVWLRSHEPNISFLVVPYLVKTNFLYTKSHRTSVSILEKSLPNSRSLLNLALPADARARGIFSASAVCWLPLGVPVGLISVWAASTNTPPVLEPLMGNPRRVRGRKVWNIFFYSSSRSSQQTQSTDRRCVCLCTLLHELPVYVGMLVCNHLAPVILKRWSLSLPAVSMNAIVFLAELGAVWTLWGPRPRNDSYLIKLHKLRAAGRQEIKALCKYYKQPVTQNGDLRVLDLLKSSLKHSRDIKGWIQGKERASGSGAAATQRDVSLESVLFYDAEGCDHMGVGITVQRRQGAALLTWGVKHRRASVKTLPAASSATFMVG